MTRFEAAEMQWKAALRVLEALAASHASLALALEDQTRIVDALAREATRLRQSPEGDLPARRAA